MMSTTRWTLRAASLRWSPTWTPASDIRSLAARALARVCGRVTCRRVAVGVHYCGITSAVPLAVVAVYPRYFTLRICGTACWHAVVAERDVLVARFARGYVCVPIRAAGCPLPGATVAVEITVLSALARIVLGP